MTATVPDWTEHLPTVTQADLDVIEGEFLKQCGPCDAGIGATCVCSGRDFRPAMARLVDEVSTLRRAMGDVALQLDALPGGTALAAYLRAEACL